MTTPIESIAHEHEALIPRIDELACIARELPSLDLQQRRERRNGVVAFVNNVLVPHARSGERGLYRRVAVVIGHPEATAPMVYDHLAIREWTERLAETDPADLEGLQELLYGLRALIVEHFRKEEELYEPLLERLDAFEELPDYETPALRHEP
ncbi:MAG: hemerythrin domain-containing protein [Gaiellaceae bacterium]